MAKQDTPKAIQKQRLVNKDRKKNTGAVFKTPQQMKGAEIMITKKEARNIANWIFNETQRCTDGGSWITYFSEIEERYGIEMDRESAEQILDAMIGYDFEAGEKPDSIEIIIGTWYFENDEDDDEEE